MYKEPKKIISKIIYPISILIGVTGMVLSLLAITSGIEKNSIWDIKENYVNSVSNGFPNVSSITSSLGMATIGSIFAMISSVGLTLLGTLASFKVYKWNEDKLYIFISVIALSAVSIALSVASFVCASNSTDSVWLFKEMLKDITKNPNAWVDIIKDQTEISPNTLLLALYNAK